MITLYDGCFCSDPAVHPKNWQKIQASTDVDWYIHYRFYDPNFIDADGRLKPKSVIIKGGMNRHKVLGERRCACDNLLKCELITLKQDGYNPFTKSYMAPSIDIPEYEIDPSTSFINALRKSMDRLIVVKHVRDDMRCIIDKLDVAVRQLRIDKEISKITRRDIKYILDQCGRNSDRFSNNRYNTYRGYLMMLFKELVELEAAPVNVIRDISKKGVTKKIKEVLTDDQRQKIDNHLKDVFPRFQKFIHLFFHSGGRKTELLQLKPGNINLQEQTYRAVIKKRKAYAEVDRTIKTIALPFWEFFLNDCADDQFIFGTLFKPGTEPMGAQMPTQYWKKFVKVALKINIDLYSLKHLNTTETVDELDENDAAAQNGQLGTGMVVNIYDVRQKSRQHIRLKNMNNSFNK